MGQIGDEPRRIHEIDPTEIPETQPAPAVPVTEPEREPVPA